MEEVKFESGWLQGQVAKSQEYLVEHGFKMDVRSYHKIPGPFKRHTDGPNRNKLIPWGWTTEEFNYLRNVQWHFTEKVDGTNVRVVWDGHRPVFMGRTANSQMPTRLSTMLQTTFTEELLEQVFGETPAILFGEGYGAGIQRGGVYRPDIAFILFDVWMPTGVWLARESIIDIAGKLGIHAVPVIARASLLSQIKTMVEYRYYSQVAQTQTIMEGLVGTPSIPLLDRKGGRIIVKLKTEDLYGLALAQDVTTISVDFSQAA